MEKRMWSNCFHHYCKGDLFHRGNCFHHFSEEGSNISCCKCGEKLSDYLKRHILLLRKEEYDASTN